MKKFRLFSIILMAGLMFAPSIMVMKDAFAAEKAAAVKKAPKYVASSQAASKLFHTPECGAAKSMKPENVIGFSSKQDAIKAGYAAHDCVSTKQAKK